MNSQSHGFKFGAVSGNFATFRRAGQGLLSCKSSEQRVGCIHTSESCSTLAHRQCLSQMFFTLRNFHTFAISICEKAHWSSKTQDLKIIQLD